jgi:hypothetical protein
VSLIKGTSRSSLISAAAAPALLERMHDYDGYFSFNNVINI